MKIHSDHGALDRPVMGLIGYEAIYITQYSSISFRSFGFNSKLETDVIGGLDEHRHFGKDGGP
jgi:hypothetical protein